jgi:hypothetical protein
LDLKEAKSQIRDLDVDNKQRPTEADLRRQESSNTTLIAKIGEFKSTIIDLKRNAKLQERRILDLTRQLAAMKVKASEAGSKEKLLNAMNKDRDGGLDKSEFEKVEERVDGDAQGEDRAGL